MATWKYERVECYVARWRLVERSVFLSVDGAVVLLPHVVHEPFYRAWNGADHLYTASKHEYSGLPDNYEKQEVECYILTRPCCAHVPLFRLYNPSLDDSFYTIDVNERDHAISRLGYVSKGIAGYVRKYPAFEHVPLYRAYHSGISDHFYTTNIDAIPDCPHDCDAALAVSDSGRRIVEIARQELEANDETKYGATSGELWCSEFVSWVYKQSGYFDSIIPDTKKLKKWFKRNATYISRKDPDWADFTPTPGDWVHFINKDKEGAHSAITECITDGDLHIIEGGGYRKDDGKKEARKVQRRSILQFRIPDTSKHQYLEGFGLRCGKRIRIPNGTASASSSGNNRGPNKAFDGDHGTWWRNRTGQAGIQWLEMSWKKPQRVTKISLTFGDHLPADYQFRFKRKSWFGSTWEWSTSITDNDRRTRSHVWFTPKTSVLAVRLYCSKYSADDYFSVIEMSIQR